jgi:hypothetical protein
MAGMMGHGKVLRAWFGGHQIAGNKKPQGIIFAWGFSVFWCQRRNRTFACKSRKLVLSMFLLFFLLTNLLAFHNAAL